MSIKSPAGGVRIGGRDYPSGSSIPDRYAHSVLRPSKRPRDPAHDIKEAPPNFGRFPTPHIITFSGIVSTLAKAYRFSDEAMRDNVPNAHAMLNDPVIAGPLFARKQMVALLEWSVQPEDDKDKELVIAAEKLTKILTRTPHFTEYRRSLMEAIWYGRCAIQHAYGRHVDRHRKKTTVIAEWLPISGDKLLFRFDDGSGKYDRHQVGIRVHPALGKDDKLGGFRTMEATADGLAYFFQPWERRQIAIHRHWIRDGEFEDPAGAGSIHGVGLRNFLYWIWYQKQETMAQLAELIDRTGSGITIYYYPTGNPQAKADVEQVAREQAHTNVLLMPHEPENPDSYRIEQIPPNTIGLDALKGIVEDWFGDMIVRFILGQTLSSRASATGMGSGVAELHENTLAQIVRYDAIGLEETITKEVLNPLRDFNMPSLRNVDFFFRISTKSTMMEEELAAIRQLWEMGGKIKSRDIFEVVGLAEPDKRDNVLQNPMIQIQELQADQAAQQNEMMAQQMQQQEMMQQQQQPEVGVQSGQQLGDDELSQMAPSEAINAQLGEQPEEEIQESKEGNRRFGPDMYAAGGGGGGYSLFNFDPGGPMPHTHVAGERKVVNGIVYVLNENFRWERASNVADAMGASAFNSALKARGHSPRDVSIAKIRAGEYPYRVLLHGTDHKAYGNSPDEARANLINIIDKSVKEDPKQYQKQDDIADRIEKAAANTASPTKGQAEAGNYEKGTVNWHQLRIVIETPKGHSRRPTWPMLTAHYGYIQRLRTIEDHDVSEVTTRSKADGDHVDIFLGPDMTSEILFCIDQVTADGSFDEHKVIAGTHSEKEARALYKSNYSAGWKVGKITPWTIPQFKTWLKDGDTSKPVSQAIED